MPLRPNFEMPFMFVFAAYNTFIILAPQTTPPILHYKCDVYNTILMYCMASAPVFTGGCFLLRGNRLRFIITNLMCIPLSTDITWSFCISQIRCSQNTTNLMYPGLHHISQIRCKMEPFSTPDWADSPTFRHKISVIFVLISVMTSLKLGLCTNIKHYAIIILRQVTPTYL